MDAFVSFTPTQARWAVAGCASELVLGSKPIYNPYIMILYVYIYNDIHRNTVYIYHMYIYMIYIYIYTVYIYISYIYTIYIYHIYTIYIFHIYIYIYIHII